MSESQINRTIQLNKRPIGAGHPCFIIAEAGVNHNGSLEMAQQLVDAAVAAHADAVKFQTFIASELVKTDAPKAQYQKRNTAEAGSQFEMLKALELSFQEFRDLNDYCESKGIVFLSTPFDNSSLDFLNELGIPAFKISSGDLTNLPFLDKVARKQKPVILSTGMSYLSEVSEAVNALRHAGNKEIALLHCVSNYPAAPGEANLRAMRTLRREFELPVGFSDHTEGLEVPIAAVALGACIIEKHFTLDRNLKGPDHRASLVPKELAELVSQIRNVEAALGCEEKKPVPSEMATAEVARRSLVAAQDLKAGTVLTATMVAIKRPGNGLPPRMLPKLLGRRVLFDVSAGDLLTLEMLEMEQNSAAEISDVAH